MSGGEAGRDQEDLMRDATAFTRRIQLQIDGQREGVFVGLRDSGAASFFFGEDPVFHFNSHFQLRRAFADGLLYKAEKRRLVSLRRHRTESESQLVRHDLDEGQQADFIAMVAEKLQLLETALRDGAATTVDQVPAQNELLPKLLDCLTRLRDFDIAQSPRVS